MATISPSTSVIPLVKGLPVSLIRSGTMAHQVMAVFLLTIIAGAILTLATV